MKYILVSIFSIFLLDCAQNYTEYDVGLNDFSWFDKPEDIIEKIGAQPDSVYDGPMPVFNLYFRQDILGNFPTLLGFYFLPNGQLNSIYYFYKNILEQSDQFSIEINKLIESQSKIFGSPDTCTKKIRIPGHSIAIEGTVVDDKKEIFQTKSQYIWEQNYTIAKIEIIYQYGSKTIQEIQVSYTLRQK